MLWLTKVIKRPGTRNLFTLSHACRILFDTKEVLCTLTNFYLNFPSKKYHSWYFLGTNCFKELCARVSLFSPTSVLGSNVRFFDLTTFPVTTCIRQENKATSPRLESSKKTFSEIVIYNCIKQLHNLFNLFNL